MAANAFKKSAKAVEEKSRKNDTIAAGEQASRQPAETNAKTAESAPRTASRKQPLDPDQEQLVMANFKITKSRRKKLKLYALEHDTTQVALLNAWIDAL